MTKHKKRKAREYFMVCNTRELGFERFSDAKMFESEVEARDCYRYWKREGIPAKLIKVREVLRKENV